MSQDFSAYVARKVKDTAKTVNIYGHLDVARKQSMANKLGSTLGARGLGARETAPAPEVLEKCWKFGAKRAIQQQKEKPRNLVVPRLS